MTNTLLEKPKIKTGALATGIIARMPGTAEEVKLLVLDAMGELASETGRLAPEGPLVSLSFSPSLVNRAGKEVYFLVIKGFLKGQVAWEQRLGNFRFHS